eukprot:CAMPEP_0184855668 /NCGR_PEP_ID=MMETSP0580-20130426/833_1 /TAXON_ID=1118495 /ORGANISM="Dactyliosolen fragilissimus" /LENGTH=377 /DNA_ID=CAMNT_0027350233 /DNA_START=112 /DNA_END=1245 /DNA_ORIENTATION=-
MMNAKLQRCEALFATTISNQGENWNRNLSVNSNSPHRSVGWSSKQQQQQQQQIIHTCLLGSSSNHMDDNEEEIFDPLLSPHAYGKKGKKEDINKKNDDGEDEWTPFKMKRVTEDFSGALQEEYKTKTSTFTREWAASSVGEGGTSSPISAVTTNSTDSTTYSNSDFTDSNNSNSNSESSSFFDPLLSPHAYPKGTSHKPILQSFSSKTKHKVGILLVDHGSKRAESNARLQSLAELYQTKIASSNHIVRASHMEIASPSILDGMRELVQEHNVTKIVCHPYFLSPGRHAIKDVPNLIEEAKEELGLLNENHHVEVLVTEAVGSKLDVMADIVGQMVAETLGEDLSSKKTRFEFEQASPTTELGGFFGEVKRMMDEQL